VLEALLAIDQGKALDKVFENYGRLPVWVLHPLGADELLFDHVIIVDGCPS
jgi:hypothetical protein